MNWHNLTEDEIRQRYGITIDELLTTCEVEQDTFSRHAGLIALAQTQESPGHPLDSPNCVFHPARLRELSPEKFATGSEDCMFGFLLYGVITRPDGPFDLYIREEGCDLRIGVSVEIYPISRVITPTIPKDNGWTQDQLVTFASEAVFNLNECLCSLVQSLAGLHSHEKVE